MSIFHHLAVWFCKFFLVFPDKTFPNIYRGLTPTLQWVSAACHYFDIHSLSIIPSKYWVQMSVWQDRQGCAMHANNVCIYRRIENTEKHTLMLLHFIFFVMFLRAWKINTQNTHCGICGSKKLLFVFPWFLHDDDTVNYGFSCWQRDWRAREP